MTDRDRYIPGVPCWIDSVHPDPAEAAVFYGELFGWDCEDTMPADVPGNYIMGRIRGEDVAAIGSVPDGAPSMAVWNTYVWVHSADATTAKAVDAGATIVTEPFDIFDAGRMAMLADPEGAVFCLWEPDLHRGARAVNEHGSLNFNDLHTRDTAAASEFYGAVFGWEALDLGGDSMWALPGYGDFLDEIIPGTLATMAELGAPTGFENVVASIVPIGDDEPDTPAHWGITFGVENADATAKLAAELGGRVLSEPTDMPWVRTTTIADPQGAVFVAAQFVPENSDLAG